MLWMVCIYVMNGMYLCFYAMGGMLISKVDTLSENLIKTLNVT